MLFRVVERNQSRPAQPNTAYLVRDQWNDWFKWITQFFLWVTDESGELQAIGAVKIGERGMSESSLPVMPSLPEVFEALDDRFFSIGQEEGYYESLNQLGSRIRDEVLPALRDLAANTSLLDEFDSEPVLHNSLLRSIRPETVRTQWHRMALGGVRLTPFRFEYHAPGVTGDYDPPRLSFEVQPGSFPPTNVHVLIGRNGVGKTTLLRRLSDLLLIPNANNEALGTIVSVATPDAATFVNLVSVTFSAFDPFRPVSSELSEQKSASGMTYSYVGLLNEAGEPKRREALRDEFVASIGRCRVSPRVERWRAALSTLETDPLFEAANVSRLTDRLDDTPLNEAAQVFEGLSSGHKIVLLILTRLIELVDERTLVLFDEPEAHLHPPLLSALVRALSDLLIERNGVAIVATHSPVVLQEVPRRCVWTLHRSGDQLRADRPSVETLGENIGTLTRDVFGLEVTRSGFHRMLSDAVEAEGTYESIIARFNDQLGLEARTIVRTLLFQRAARGEGE